MPPFDSYSPNKFRQDFFANLQPGQLMDNLIADIPGVYYFVKDADSRFINATESFAVMLGADSVEDLIGKTDYDYSADFLAEMFHEDDREVLDSGRSIRKKYELVPTSDGSLDWLCTSKVPLFGVDGSVVGLAGVSRMIRDSDSVYAEHPEMRQIVQFVRENFKEKISVAQMAKAGGVSPSSQERLFKKTFGLTPLMYLRRTRLNAACKLLRETDIGLAEIAGMCGFNDQTNMTRAFSMELKITPHRYRRRFDDRSRRSARGGSPLLLPVA